MDESVFWADHLAGECIDRKAFMYSNKKYALPKRPAIKTSSSLSGVLHIGRLTDIVRGEAVYKGLKDAGVKARFIYVAEDMDPLRKIPKGVPKSYEEYIGVPVTDIPDPEGCHDTYADHHVREFFDVFGDFVQEEPERFSMRAEYKKGTFNESVKTVMGNYEKVRGIIESFKDEPLDPGWIPWQPVCDNCGKIITTKATKYENGKVHYVCKDYKFKTMTAKGCGYEGESDVLKGNGKMPWKSEWASQWKVWDVVAEGAGKEYNVPNSAFFINTRICEDVLGYPAPKPIFYEHITVGGGQKMSASVGNVVYPRDWLEVAPAEALRLLFLKRINTTRDFKWEDVPRLMDELEQLEAVYFDVEEVEDHKERMHLKRLYEMVQVGKMPKKFESVIPYSTAAMVSQIVPLDNKERLVSVLRNLGHEMTERNEKILHLAEKWANKYSPQFKLIEKLDAKTKAAINPAQKKALAQIAAELDSGPKENELAPKIFQAANDNGLKPGQVFQAIYTVLLGEKRGPRAAPFILSLDKDFVQKRFRLES